MAGWTRLMALTMGTILAVLGALSRAADEKSREIPVPFAPFEYLIGSWKGTGVPTANKVRGWEETHAWAWKFEKGQPVGMSVTMEGSKALTKGQLAFDAASKKYTLTAIDANHKAATYAGTLD